MKTIRILQIMPEFGLAGAEIMCENLCTQIHGLNGFSIIVVSLYRLPSPITERLRNKGIKVIFLDKKKGLDLSIIGKLKRLMIVEKIDIVHTHRYMMQYAIPAAIFAKVKYRVHTIHNVAKKEIGWIARKLAFIFYKLMKVVPISISPLVRETVSKEYHIPMNKIPMIYNGINLEKCLRKSDYRLKNECFQFIHIGRFSSQKNHAMILEAAERLKNMGYQFQINFIGEGPLFNDIKNEISIRNLEECIKLLGLKDDVLPYLNNSDCFILPSIYEGMPISLIEAMGTGLPVIVTAVGGMPDMIENEISGLIINVSPEELINAMIKVIKKESVRISLGNNAYVKSKEFSVKNMTEGYLKIYKMICGVESKNKIEFYNQ